MVTFKFTVEGVGEFPYYMLRFADSFHSQQDADNSQMFERGAPLRKVTIVGAQMPQQIEWARAGWPLVEIANTPPEFAKRPDYAAPELAPAWTDVQLLQLHRALREWVNCTATTEPTTRAAVLELLK